MTDIKDTISIINPLTEDEIASAQQAEYAAWRFLGLEPESLDIKPIIERFREGFFTIFVNNKGAGNFSTFRINYDLTTEHLPDWQEISGNGTAARHDPNGTTLYGMSLGVDPKYRGMQLGQKLVEQAKLACKKFGCRRLVLGCRIPDYHYYSDIPVETYIRLKRQDGQFLDSELRFYSRCGLKFIKPIPEYMSGECADPDSLNYGVLSVWNNPDQIGWDAPDNIDWQQLDYID